MADENWLFGLEVALAGLAAEASGKRSHYPLHHGTMRAGIYVPKQHDPQLPHRQDELYIVVSGTGTFVKNDQARPFKAHDVIFVEAGANHHFVNFSDDFMTWVVFWGPDGGEN